MPFVNVVNKLVSYIKESYYELKLAQWPNRKELIRLTVSLLVISAGMGLFVSVFDYIFKGLLTILVTR